MTNLIAIETLFWLFLFIAIVGHVAFFSAIEITSPFDVLILIVVLILIALSLVFRAVFNNMTWLFAIIAGLFRIIILIEFSVIFRPFFKFCILFFIAEGIFVWPFQVSPRLGHVQVFV